MKTKLLLFMALLSSGLLFSQINVAESFETGFPTGWTTTGATYPAGSAYDPTYSCLGVSSMAAQCNSSNVWVMIVTPSYVSNGGQIDVSFQYKPKYSFSGNAYIYYETNNSGTWNLIGGASPTNSTNCNLISRTLNSGIIPSGTSVKFRMQINYVTGASNALVYFDNVNITQTTPVTIVPQLIAQYNFNNTLNNIQGNTSFTNVNSNLFGLDRNGMSNESIYMVNGGMSAAIANLPIANAERTVSLWIKAVNISTVDNVVFMYGSQSANGAYGFSFKPTTINNFGWANDLSGSATIPVNTWKHIVCTYNTSGIATIYIDGNSVLSGSKPTWNTATSNFSLAGFDGYIDDLKIYNYALSQADVTSLFTTNALSSQNFNQNKLEVSLYPNPANDVLNIEMTNEVKAIEIYNIQGQKVKSATQKQINVSDLANGMYMIRIQDTDNAVSTKKFMKN